MRRAFHLDGLYDGEAFRPSCTLCIDEGRVAGILDREPDGDWTHIGCGGIALPGLVNSHHHAYSALARGMAVPAARSFRERLETLWWRLDGALSLEDVRISALATAVDCLRHGCTCVVDHHSSPNAVRGSLEEVARGFGEAGLRCVACLETSDRGGPGIAQGCIEENLEFEERHRNDPGVRGMFGLHASFTLESATLERIARLKPGSVPVHVHVAEDLCDVEHARGLGFAGPLERLERAGLLAPGSILAHAIHLAEAERGIARRLWIAHCPESNMNNCVGYADLDLVDQARVILGTDGMTSSMLAGLRTAFLGYSALGGRARPPAEVARDILLVNPRRYLAGTFGWNAGAIRVGEIADLAIFPYEAPTPVDEASWTSHLAYGLTCSPRASWVYAQGRCVLEDSRVASIEEGEVLAEAAARARALWGRLGERGGRCG